MGRERETSSSAVGVLVGSRGRVRRPAEEEVAPTKKKQRRQNARRCGGCRKEEVAPTKRKQRAENARRAAIAEKRTSRRSSAEGRVVRPAPTYEKVPRRFLEGSWKGPGGRVVTAGAPTESGTSRSCAAATWRLREIAGECGRVREIA